MKKKLFCVSETQGGNNKYDCVEVAEDKEQLNQTLLGLVQKNQHYGWVIYFFTPAQLESYERVLKTPRVI